MNAQTTLAAVVLAVASLNPQEAQARSSVPFSDDQAVRAIVGEAENQGYLGMLAVAHAIRNRGTLQGVVGAERNLRFVPAWVWDKARQAWKSSATGPDITYGATHWENVRAFGMPSWADDTMKCTTVIKDHFFFKKKEAK